MHTVEAKGLLSSTCGMNVYRGCEHGCIYCDSRSKCYNMQHEFEDVEVKINAPQLLRLALKTKRTRCMIGTGSMCDPYMPIEKELKITQKCLKIIDELSFGATIITKSDLILRDIELLCSINRKTKCVVQTTLTTADDELCKIIEPNVCVTSRRVEMLKILQQRNIPTVVWLSPILPFINDTQQNIDTLLDYCIDAGVRGIICFGMGMTLREGNREYFYAKLDEHFGGLREKYVKRYGLQYSLMSPNNHELMRRFYSRTEKAGIMNNADEIFAYLHRFEDKIYGGEQLKLF